MNSDNESHSQKVDGFPVVLVNPEEMVVELVDLAPHTLIPAEAAFEALAEAHADLEVPAVDVNDAAARTVDLPHGTLSERREIERAGTSVCQIYVEFHCFHFVQFSCKNTLSPIRSMRCLCTSGTMHNYHIKIV